MKVKYIGYLPEVKVGLLYGDTKVKQGEPFEISEVEYEALKDSPNFEVVKESKSKAKGGE
jgi:hypothetical protein